MDLLCVQCIYLYIKLIVDRYVAVMYGCDALKIKARSNCPDR